MIQYDASPVINQLLTNFSSYLDLTGIENEFYNVIWNIDTAQGIGLDIWAIIVGAPSRYVPISSESYLGFKNSNPTQDWLPFGQAIFYSGTSSTAVFQLSDEAYRLVILTKAFGNVSGCASPTMNKMLQMLFPNRGKCYIVDNNDMTISAHFDFTLYPWEITILTQTSVLPRPAGVKLDLYY